MGSPVLPVPSTTPQGPDVEDTLSRLANNAIASGKDPVAVSQRLGVMVDHLRANPDFAAQARSALAAGRDPTLIGARIYQHATQAPAAPTPAPAPAPPAAPQRVASTPQYTPGEQFGALVGQGATMGFAGKILGGLDAADKYIHGDHNFAANYAATRDRITGAEDAAVQAHPIAAPVTELVAGIGSSIPSMATSGARAASNLLADAPKATRAAIAGMGYGALQGAGHATGNVSDYAHEIARDAAFGGVTGGTLSGAGSLAKGAGSLLVDAVGRPVESTPLIRVGNVGIGRVEGTLDRARTKVQQLSSEDAASGFVPPAAHPSLPAMPLNQAGPAVEGYAEGIANRPGPGRSLLVNALTRRQQQMRPAITQAFDNATGTTAQSGDDLVRALNAEHQQMAGTNAVRDQVASDVKSAQPDVQVARPADVWQQMIGGEHPNAIQHLRMLDNAQRAQANQLYSAAREATNGQPMQSPTLDAFLETPVGKAAMAWAKVQKANRMSALPTVTETRFPSQLQSMVDEAQPQDRDALLQRLAQSGAAITTEREVPDPETLHYAKQYVSKLARLGVNDGAQGTIAVQAQGALPTFDAIRSELPEPWQKADAAYAGWERQKSALNTGRNLIRTQVNPAGVGRKPLTNSLDAIEQQVQQMSPEERGAFGVGAQGAISDLLKSGKSTLSFVRDMNDPTSDMARKVVLATGDQTAPAKLARALAPRTFPQQIPEAPPAPALSSQGQGATMGLDVFNHRVAPPADAPEKSLAVFGDRARALDPEAKVMLQQGAAQAARGQWERAGRSVQSPGRVFDFTSPEKAEQLSYAFQSPGKQADFQNAVSAWDAAQAQSNRILGNSRTGFRGAQGSGMSVTPSTLTAGAKAIARSLINKATGNLVTRNQQALEEQVARLLVDPSLGGLPLPQRAARIHDGILDAVHQNLVTAGTGAATPQPQRQQ